ncbi:hypothetical protein [Ideonella sp. BN130291]|uniref:hypothetical protein n=1 Tax=Ideonella sp. BN130291 TaxID=3112940 RepID=UPI002E25E6FA|nr:hypothetical protein [Ideonella sp. BN130291]
MNRVLSWPHTPIVPGLLEPLKKLRNRTTVTERGTVRFELPLGVVEMEFPANEQHLAPGTEVLVWWKGGGFVCAPAAELKAEERQARVISRRVKAARARLEAARQERAARDSTLSGFGDLPPVDTADHPLLQPGR